MEDPGTGDKGGARGTEGHAVHREEGPGGSWGREAKGEPAGRMGHG